MSSILRKFIRENISVSMSLDRYVCMNVLSDLITDISIHKKQFNQYEEIENSNEEQDVVFHLSDYVEKSSLK